MEVVSPLSFARPNQGGKRRFGSPIHGGAASATGDDLEMDCSGGYACQPAKRRKRFSNEGGGGDSSFSFQAKENWSLSPFVQAPSRSPLGAAAHSGPSAKRSRGSSPQPPQDDGAAQKLQQLQQVVDQQAAEIHRLKSEKDTLQSSATQLSSQHAKVEQENKILKRAVAIQQERGTQMTSELEGARQFKAQAEERIRRLEQMNLTLQYQLQAQSSSGNDFMGFSPRPPDVY